MRVESVSVGPDAVEAVLAFDRGEPLRATARVRDRALALLPGLRGHRCDNGEGLSFAEEAASTELAHLVEHAALELMALAGSPHTLAGRTTWDFAADGPGVFRVRLAYDDDLVALGALKAAVAAVGWCASGDGPAPDVAAEARRLRALRRR